MTGEYKGGNDMLNKLTGMKSETVGGRKSRKYRRRGNTLGRKSKNCGKSRRRRRTRARMSGMFD